LWTSLRARLAGVSRFTSTLRAVRLRRPPRRVSKTVRAASIECTRMLLLEVLRDGVVTDSERRTLRATLVLFAQLEREHGDCRITMPNANASCESVAAVYPSADRFVGQVAQGLDRHILQPERRTSRRSRSPERRSLSRSRSPRRDPSAAPERAVFNPSGPLFRRCTKSGLERLVSLADAESLLQRATAEELLAVCEDEEELETQDQFGHIPGLCLSSLLALVPQSYMLRSRIRELYKAGRNIDRCLVGVAAKFFCLSFMYSFCREWLQVMTYLMQLRVLLCFTQDLPVLCRLTYPLRFLAELITEWGRDHWLLGCGSFLSRLPVRLARCIVPPATSSCALGALAGWLLAGRLRRSSGAAARLGCAVLLALCAGAADLATGRCLSQVLEPLRWALTLLTGLCLDFAATAALSRAVLLAVEGADEVIQPNLMLMSARLGTRARQMCDGATPGTRKKRRSETEAPAAGRRRSDEETPTRRRRSSEHK